jgi:hypothetical protein
MTITDYKLELNALKRALEITILDGEKKGKEISMAYECGMYLGAIKAVIQHIDELTQNND